LTSPGKRPGLSTSILSLRRVSQIERGEVFTVEVVGCYVEALGGELTLLADFGDRIYRVNSEQLRAS
jgi:hypothetical protein